MSSGSSHVSVDSLGGISSDSSSLDVDLLDLNSISDDDSSCSDEAYTATSCLSGLDQSESEAKVQRKPPRLRLPRINSVDSLRFNVETVKETGLDSARSGQSRGDSVSTRGGQTLERQPNGGRVLVSVDLLTPSFDVEVPYWKGQRNGEALGYLRSNCAEKFGIRSDRVKMYELSSVIPGNNGTYAAEGEPKKIGIEIVGSEFTLAKLEEIIQARDKLEREEKHSGRDEETKLLQARVRDLEHKLILSEKMRLKAHNALQDLRHEIDLLESALQTSH